MPDTQNIPWWSWLLAPNSGVNPFLNYGVPVPGAQTRVQPPLNQANPYTTYVSPTTPQPTGAVPVVGQPGTQSGPAVAPPGGFPPPPDLVVTARRYRAQHGLAASDDAATDALNAESLQAAQAGRTFLDRNLAAQYGQPMPAGVSGPRTDVVNALTMPPGAAQTAVAQQSPALLAQNNLLQQGIY